MSNTARITLILVLLIVVAAVTGVWLTHARHPAASAARSAPAASSSSTVASPSPSAPSSLPPAVVPGAPSAAPAGAAAPSAAAVQPDLVLLAGSSLDGCRLPAQPPEPPAGEHATRAQMLVSQHSAKDFDSATNVYLACLDQAVRNFEARYRPLLTAANLRQIQAMQVRLHNAGVDLDQSVADRFNRQLHIFLARGHN